MTKKTVLRMQEPGNDEDLKDLEKEVKSFQGSDGKNLLVVFDEVDPTTGEIKKSGAFALDTIESNIDDKIFEGWQKDLTNNIRKAIKNLPSVLIEIEESKLGTTSGEAIIQAVNFYNAMTEDDRVSVSEMFQEIFSNFDDDLLLNNTNWKIKPLDLNGKFTNIGTTTIN